MLRKIFPPRLVQVKPKLKWIFQQQFPNSSLASAAATPKENPNTSITADTNDSGINDFLEKVRSKAKLGHVAPQMDYLFGRKIANESGGETDVEALDIIDKTEVILQSSHPVRYIMEREMKRFAAKDERPNPSLNEWMILFGRSLTRESGAVDQEVFEKALLHIANAVECGVFSSEIHSTIINIPFKMEPLKTREQFHMGNKYTVLVGDFFAIKCISFIEKAKNSKVFLKMSEAAEEFTSAPFASQLLHPEIVYPFLPSLSANLTEWGIFTTKSLGYLGGGFQAILSLTGGESKYLSKVQNEFLPNFLQMLKVHREIEEISEDSDGQTEMISPFLFISLPALLYLQKYPQAHKALVGKIQNNFNCNLNQEILYLREEIRSSGAVHDSKLLLEEFGERSKESFREIGVGNPYYAYALTQLIDIFCNTPTTIKNDQKQILYAQNN